MEFKFDPRQQFQLDAIDSVVDLFEGQPRDVESILTKLRQQPTKATGAQEVLDLSTEVGAIGNNLVLDDDVVLQNLQMVQDRNGLEIRDMLADGGLNFDIEMETGTGKTYVYLRTVFELAKRYNFTKFVILVPSVPIKEGVATSVRLMRQHFKDLYSIPFDFSIYSGDSAEQVQSFATSTNLQIMLLTIGSLRGDKNNLIIHQYRDKLNGLRPIDYLSATRPVLIMDEPQNMESKLSKSSIGELNPLCTLRYSATHRKQRNVVYRLDPVDAHELGLVKQIVVADVLQEGADAMPYIKLVDVKRDPKWRAKLELVNCQSDGKKKHKEMWVSQGKDLADLTGNSAYDNNWRINEISLEPAYIELTNHGILQLGETIGGNSDEVYREMIRETIREHLRKEAQLRTLGIKVLSLFFIDKVDHYLSYADDGSVIDGKFAEWFDEFLIQERGKLPEYGQMLPQDPVELRSAYFSVMKAKGGVEQYVDSSESGNKRDDAAYDLIMRDKERLLDQSEPVRFIFSHSALREGWDNPNVFQICALREMGKTLERRQTIGRGLRLPVNQNGDRIADRSIAQLSVIANESYQDFAKELQADYVEAGVSLGNIRRGEFSKLPFMENGEEKRLGYRKSETIWEHLNVSGFIDSVGRVLPSFSPDHEGFTLSLPDEFSWAETQIVEILKSCKIENFVKSKRKRQSQKLNKELYASDDFEEFWYRISRKTTYRVSLDRETIIEQAVNAIEKAGPIQPIHIQVTKAGLTMQRGGIAAEEKATRASYLAGSYPLPDIVEELQQVTSLTRRTIIDILVQSQRLSEFLSNPNDFIQMVRRQIETVLAASVVEGIQYEKVAGSIYELRELQNDGRQERDRFINQLYKVKNEQKTDFDYIVYDSDVERKFAELLDSREDVKLFMKLPAKFKVPTPVGEYNPDWAIVKHHNGEDRIYMIRETKSTADESFLRPSEVAKIKCGEQHFAAIGVGYEVSTPDNWKL